MAPSARPTLALAAAALVGAWLRLGALDREGLWLDELFTVRAATRESWAALIAELAADVHPPLWFFLLHLLPEGPDASWRVPSALVGLVGVALAAALARSLAGGGTHGARATLLAAALTATAPGLVLLDREARANAALSAAAVGLVLALVRGRSVAVVLVAAVLVNLHPFGPFVLAAAALFLYLDPGDGTGSPPGRGVLLLGAGALALLPWASVLVGQADQFAASPWYRPPPGDSVGWVLAELADDQPGLWLGPLLGLGVAARLEGPGERRGLVLAAAFVVGVVLLPQAASYLWAPILRSRSALPLLPVVLVAASLGLARMGRPGVILGLVAATGQGLAAWSATRLEVRREQWREAAAWAAPLVPPGGLVLATHPQLWRHYLGEHVDLRDAASLDVDAAPGAVVLLGHEPDPTALHARLGATVLEEARFHGVWGARVGGFARPLPLNVDDPARGRADGTHAELWGATSARTPPLRARGACAVHVRAHEDAAGVEPAELRVRVVLDGVAVLDERLAVGGAGVTAGAPLVHGEPDHNELVVEVAFTNDAVVDGADRNAYLDEIRLDCR